MRILWHSVAPWVPTGYGSQTALWVPRIASLGHDVAISAFSGLSGGPSEWQGFRVYPGGAAQHAYGGDVIGLHAAHWRADLVITLMDFWAMPHDTLAGLHVAPWMPVDCQPLSIMDWNRLAAASEIAKISPVAMTRFGERQITEAGWRPLYVPHGIDTSVFRPPADREALRREMGVSDRFVIMMNASNVDKAADRKAWFEQMAAFAQFHARHPDALLMAHTMMSTPAGLDLEGMAERLGCAGAVKFTPPYLMTSGLLTPADLARAYGAADLYSGCAKAEGFGLPIIEATACGTPAVVTDWSAMPEVGGPAWRVPGHRFWAEGHKADWRAPDITAIVRAYEKAYQRGAPYHAKKGAAREHALAYDADRVLTQHWKPALETLLP